MISRFKETADETDDPTATLEFDVSLSPLQRRKAHIMCAFNKMKHNSEGTGLTRKVRRAPRTCSRAVSTVAQTLFLGVGRRFCHDRQNRICADRICALLYG
jgi:hypothetical protein